MTEFWPWWLGGLCIGAIAALYPLLSGRLLGVSSLYAALLDRPRDAAPPSADLERALLAATEAEFGPDSAAAPESRSESALRDLRASSESSRLLFLLGMLGGGAIAAAASNGWAVRFSLGERFDARYGAGFIPLAVLLLGGVAIGLGARMGGGCTSGHGISGVARGERGSLLTTLVFWGTALVVTWILALLQQRV